MLKLNNVFSRYSPVCVYHVCVGIFALDVLFYLETPPKLISIFALLNFIGIKC